MPSVFLSYSHKDEAWKNRLKTHLGVLEAQGLLDTWDDRRIEAGSNWLKDIQDAMDGAGVAVLLISAEFLTSKFILGQEVPKLLERRVTEGLTVIPVIVRSCAWLEIGWLREIQTRPLDGQPLAGLRGDRRDAEMASLAREILRLLRTGEDRKREARRDDFLSRVEAVCRLREPDAEIQRYRGGKAGDYLRVVRRDGDFQDTYPVGAVEHGLSQDFLQVFLEEIDAPYRTHDSGLISRLVYGGEPASADLIAQARAHRIRLVSFVEHQGLVDFRSYLSRQTAKLAADPIYPPGLYVSQRMRTLSILGREEAETTDALAQVREWLDGPIGRFIVLLGDFGTGKTFLLHELARRMGEAEEGLIPILLQMRSLEKGRSLDALLAQHFAQEGMEGFSPSKFRYMLEQGRIALLFDGFDELALRVTYDRATEHFATLLQAGTGNAKVVLTSRRQHFLSETQVKTALAQQVETVSGHRLAILQPFEREQVHRFLVKFFEGDAAKAEARLSLIDRVRDLLGLSANPRLLGFIAELPEEQLIAACAEGQEITAAKLYELLLHRWLVYEFDRVHPKGAPPGLSVTERWQAVTRVALRLWQKTDRFVSLSDLSEETARVVQAVGPGSLDADVTTFQVGSGTLLVRDEEGNFAFLHQSILEWLVARNAAEALAEGADPETLAAREISPLMADFFASLAGRQRAVSWARTILSAPAGETAKKNALLLLERQKEEIPETLDLAGQDLRGKDYSGHDLSGVNLSGADLTQARLIGTSLANAQLRQAKLREADLRRADLTGADLSETDLTGARLFGAVLRGARLIDAELRRAKLLGADLDPDSSLPAEKTFGAALDLTDLTPQGGVGEACHAVAWSPDGELLASATGSIVRLWEAKSGREIRALVGHQSTVRSLAFSPDGKSLASGSSDRTARFWRVGNGQLLQILSGHQNTVWSVAFSPDGKSFASGSSDRTVRLWHVDTGYLIRILKGHQDWVRSVAFSPDCKSLASGSDDNTVRLWDVDSGAAIKTFQEPQNWVLSVAFSPDGKTLASGSYDNIVRLWHVDAGEVLQTFTGHKSRVVSVAFSPDGKTLASGSDDSTIRFWQIDSGHESKILKGHQLGVSSVAFSPDGKSLASSSADKTLRLWQVDSGRESKMLREQGSAIRSVAFSPDGKTLAGGSDDNTVRLWTADGGSEIRAFTSHRSGVLSVAFSPDGKTIASGSDDNTVRLWRVKENLREIRALRGHQNRVWSVAFSPNGKDLVSVSEDHTVRFWDESGREIRSFTGHRQGVWSVAFSPDSKTFATGSSVGEVHLWPVGNDSRYRSFTGHRQGVWSLAFSPEGRLLASGSEDNTIRLWQVDSARTVATLTGHQQAVRSVAFSPNGKLLASGSSDNTIRLWQVHSGRKSTPLKGHHSAVLSVCFSPDGKTLASGSDDGTLRLWNVAAGHCLAVLLPLSEGWVAYSPDGRYKFGGVPAGGFWHVASLCRFEIGELDEWVPGLRLTDDASFFDLPPWKPEVRVPER